MCYEQQNTTEPIKERNSDTHYSHRISQTQKNKYCNITCLRESKTAKFIEKESESYLTWERMCECMSVCLCVRNE